jgi:uncharacterized membrane protein/protein-disulfide isomerase
VIDSGIGLAMQQPRAARPPADKVTQVTTTTTPMSTATAGPPADPPRGRPILWVVAALAVIAAATSGYLFWLSLTALAPAGCGPSSGCEEVLTSRWSRWFGLPVSALAVVTYLAIAGVAIGLTRARSTSRGPLLAAALLALGLAAGGAAGWFTYLQFFRLGHLCPYCLGVHVCGLIVAVLVIAWVLLNRRRATGAAVGWRGGVVATALAALAVTTVAVGQVLQPERHPPVQRAKAEKYRLPGGSLVVDVSQLPRLGPASAPHTVIVLADYTCPHCRDLHAALPAVIEHYKGQVSLTLMPVAMNSKCNPLVAVTDPRHTYACELAKLALAVWRAKPDAYGDMDAYLFAPEEPRTPADARRKAVDLVGEAALARAEADPWVPERLGKDIDVYRVAGAGSVPKLIFPQDAISFPPKDAKKLIELIDYQLELKPTR